MGDEHWHAPGEAGSEEHDQAMPLFGAERLNPEEASRLLARGPGRLVVWVGEQGAGKTMLCVRLYECQRRAGTGARFAGSWTLLAFEQLAYPGRIGARAAAPSPAHAEPSSDGRDILHLALSADGDPLHLLFADLPGEIYRRLADNQIPATEIPWLQRADKLGLLVDGERICDPTMRATVLTRARQFVERLRSSGLPNPGCRLALVVTKWDRILEDPAAIDYWQPREAELLEELRELDPGAPALRVAAGILDQRHDDDIVALRGWLLDAVDAAPEPILGQPPGALPFFELPPFEQEPFEQPAFAEPTRVESTLEQPPFEQPPFFEQAPFEQPVFEQPAHVEPTLEQAAFERPAFEPPAPAEPPIEEPAFQQPPYEPPAPEEPPIQEPPFEPPAPEEPPIQEPPFEPPASEEPSIHEPAFEHHPFEDPALEQPPVEEPALEERPVEEPAALEPVALEPVDGGFKWLDEDLPRLRMPWRLRR